VIRRMGLTSLQKVQALQHWEFVKADYLREKDAGMLPAVTGGLGYPDPEVFDICDRLNRIAGIVTLQSCSGHRQSVVDDVSLWSGQLWIGMTAWIRDRYVALAPGLAALPMIERVGLLFHHEVTDVADITFAGLNVSAEALTESAGVIVGFFEHLVSPAQSGGERPYRDGWIEEVIQQELAATTPPAAADAGTGGDE
jgi:hypothetical protein